MSDGTFQKLGKSTERMFGSPCVLVCGYRAEEQEDIIELLDLCGLSRLPVVFASDDVAGISLGEVVRFESGTGKGVTSGLRRAIIMSGFSEEELHLLLGCYRKEGLPAQLWATLTPVSEEWTLESLLNELAAEAENVKKRQQEKASSLKK